MATAIGREWTALYASVVAAARRRGAAGFPVTAVATAAVIILAMIGTGPAGHHFIRTWADEYARLPLRPALERLLPSFAAPTPRLPVWGAILQVALVFGIAEALYGSRVTAVAAFLCHAAATLSARLFVWLGPHVAFGMVHIARVYADSGPSGATVGLMAFLAVRRRHVSGGLLLIAFIVAEWVVKHGLAQREHIVAALLGAALAVIAERWASAQGATLPTPEATLVSAGTGGSSQTPATGTAPRLP